jgi:hypothetical protein
MGLEALLFALFMLLTGGIILSGYSTVFFSFLWGGRLLAQDLLGADRSSTSPL